MTSPTELIPAAETTRMLGYRNRSSLTRLVQQGIIKPVFTGSGKSGEQFFDRADIERVLAERAA